MDCHKAHEGRVGVRGSRQGEKATEMIGGEHLRRWAFMRDRREPAHRIVIRHLVSGKGFDILVFDPKVPVQ